LSSKDIGEIGSNARREGKYEIKLKNYESEKSIIVLENNFYETSSSNNYSSIVHKRAQRASFALIQELMKPLSHLDYTF
jgi:hypothetical protein